MIAPRKTLWSTPESAIDKVQTLLSPLEESDIFYDVGCGDGRVLIHLAQTTPCRHFVGIEIDQDRANEARRNCSARLDPSIKVEIRCENALESNYDDATVVFLYLIPRGLKLIKPLLLRGRESVVVLGGNEGVAMGQNERRDKKSKQKQSQSSEFLVDENDRIKWGPTLSYDHDTTLAVEEGRSLLRVATYMAGWSDVQHVAKELCTVEHQKGAEWPVYLYHFH